MAGISGNDNLLYVRRHHYVTFDGTSDQSAALSPNTKAVSLYATAACYVAFGTNPTAAAPGAEKTVTGGTGFYIPATTYLDVALPVTGTDAAPIKIAAIQVSGGGDLHIYERSEI